jgi:tetratricopeptide (TPR) repeat protein
MQQSYDALGDRLLFIRKTLSYGMELVYCMIVTVPWTMQRKPSRRFFGWIRVSLPRPNDALFVEFNHEDLDFDKANEILFRLGIIYKQQSKYDESLRCFDRILRNPPSPLAHADIWFQIGHVYEQQKDVSRHVLSFFIASMCHLSLRSM